MHYAVTTVLSAVDGTYLTLPSSAFDQVEVGLPDRSDKTKEERFVETFNQFYEAFLQEKRIE